MLIAGIESGTAGPDVIETLDVDCWTAHQLVPVCVWFKCAGRVERSELRHVLDGVFAVDSSDGLRIIIVKDVACDSVSFKLDSQTWTNLPVRYS